MDRFAKNSLISRIEAAINFSLQDNIYLHIERNAREEIPRLGQTYSGDDALAAGVYSKPLDKRDINDILADFDLTSGQKKAAWSYALDYQIGLESAMNKEVSDLYASSIGKWKNRFLNCAIIFGGISFGASLGYLAGGFVNPDTYTSEIIGSGVGLLLSTGYMILDKILDNKDKRINPKKSTNTYFKKIRKEFEKTLDNSNSYSSS